MKMNKTQVFAFLALFAISGAALAGVPRARQEGSPLFRSWLSALNQMMDQSELRARGMKELPVYPGYLAPRTRIRLEAADFLKFKSQDASSAPQCFLKNPGAGVRTLTAGRGLDLISLSGTSPLPARSPAKLSAPRFTDWDFALPEAGLLLRCEFPKGVAQADLHRELKNALMSYFELRPVAPSYLDVRSLMADSQSVSQSARKMLARVNRGR